MLTLTRRKGERIAIGNNVELTILDVSGGRVRLGIRAPRSLPVHRGEVVDRIEEENRRAMVAQVNAEEFEEKVILLPEGLFGLPEHTEFLLGEPDIISNSWVLVSRLDPAMRLYVVEASSVVADYPTEDAKKAANLEDTEVAVATVVRLPKEGNIAKVNLRAPIVIGLESREGVQVILQREDLNVEHPLPITVQNKDAAHP